MRDLFARWAKPESLPALPKSGATWATRATGTVNAINHSVFRDTGDVARISDARATRATHTPGAGNRVAHVAQTPKPRATPDSSEELKQHKDLSAALPTLPLLPAKTAKPEKNEPCTLTDCIEMIGAAFDAVEADYEPGALDILDGDPDLARRFRETRNAIDAAVRAGPSEAQLRAALAGHVAVIRECVSRARARRERTA